MKKLYIIILLFNAIVLFSQDVELNLVNAKDEFKWGVKFYNQGLYEKSVFSFEKSLSFNSVDNLTHMWLGRAYYMKGDIEAALKEWSQLSDNGNAPLWLDSSIDIISSDLGVASRLYKASEWVPLYSKDFSRPTSILPLDDGGIIIVSFLSDTVIKMNANGGIVSKFDGGFEPFNRPFDIILDSNDGYIVSEFMGDKVSFVNNLGIKTKSVEPDDIPFAGPQYLTKESDRYFYVSDWGNKRVCKFDMDGNYILSISHDLLKGPAGVLVIGDNIYVADQINKTLLLFDSSGNYIETTIKDGLEAPEGLTLKSPGIILIADGIDLKEYQIADKKLTSISDLQGKANRITKGTLDVNGNILATDFNLGEFVSLTDVSSLYGGLYIIIDKISTYNFPYVDVEFQLYNREGQPIVGLDNSNFLISENNLVVPKRNVIFRGSDHTNISLGVVLDMDIGMSNYLEDFYDITESLENDMSSEDNITLIKANSIPTIVARNQNSIIDNISDITSDEFSIRTGIDISIKLAASSISSFRGKREILLISDGISKDDDFGKYSLEEIKNFLKVNHISLTVLYLNKDKNMELEYLISESGGGSRYLFSNIGSKGLLDDARLKKSGFYVVNYESLQNIDRGENYTTVEIEVNYIRKSGRSESGFFVPVKIIE